MERGAEAAEQVEALTGNRTLFLTNFTNYQAAIANGLDTKTVYEYGLDVHHLAAMFPGLTVQAFSRQHVQDFINERVVAQGRAKATALKQVSRIRNYWSSLCSTDESLRDRRPFTDLIWPNPTVAAFVSDVPAARRPDEPAATATRR